MLRALKCTKDILIGHTLPSKKQPKLRCLFLVTEILTALKKLKYKNEYGIDGIMIGRAAIGYPWILMKLSIILILANIWLNRQLLIEVQYVIIVNGMERRTLGL
jgi:tRNA-dihydrouridine synthase